MRLLRLAVDLLVGDRTKALGMVLGIAFSTLAIVQQASIFGSIPADACVTAARSHGRGAACAPYGFRTGAERALNREQYAFAACPDGASAPACYGRVRRDGRSVAIDSTKEQCVKTQFIAVAAAATLVAGAAQAGDVAAGKAKFDAVCADCHEPADHAGVPAAELTAKLKDIAAGKIKHKGKIKPTDAEIADLVAYFGTIKK